MMTVKEVARLTGVSARTLQYYDSIGLLKPSGYTESGYRLYDAAALERLQQILLFKELEFSLRDIGRIIDAPGFDRKKALDRQIEMLMLKREHLDAVIGFAREIKDSGAMNMDFSVFDTKKTDEYAKRAKEQWGATEEYKEFEEKSADRSAEDEKKLTDEFMQLFEEFGQMISLDPADKKVQLKVKKLQDYITEHYYRCDAGILQSLGKMYAAGGEFTENIDSAGGAGTAAFTAKAIELYCKGRS